MVGGVAAMSSTAIVSKVLAERMQLHSEFGRQAMGVLLFQDLAVIPLLVLIPALSLSSGAIAAAIGAALVKAGVVLAIVLYLGQRLVRPLFDLVARQKSSELFVLFVLLVTLGLAWVTEQAGLSLTLGAFLAGMLISETEYRYQVEDYIKPFRDVLLGLFFVTIGMLLDWRELAAHFVAVAAVFALMLAAKFAVIFALGRAFGNARPTALRTALALAPAGEFGFVLLSLAQREGAVGAGTLQVILAAALLSMIVAPLLLTHMERIVLYFVQSEWTSRAVALHELAVKSMATKGHVIVCGYGRSGQALAAFLESEKIPVIALDSDPERVREAAAAGDSVVFGDASRREVLVAAALSRAAAVVVSFADTPKALGILAHVRELRPALPVVVRTLDDSDVARLQGGWRRGDRGRGGRGLAHARDADHADAGSGRSAESRAAAACATCSEQRYQIHAAAFFHGVTDSDADDSAARCPAPSHAHGRPQCANVRGQVARQPAQPRRARRHRHRRAPHRHRARSTLAPRHARAERRRAGAARHAGAPSPAPRSAPAAGLERESNGPRDGAAVVLRRSRRLQNSHAHGVVRAADDGRVPASRRWRQPRRSGDQAAKPSASDAQRAGIGRAVVHRDVELLCELAEDSGRAHLVGTGHAGDLHGPPVPVSGAADANLRPLHGASSTYRRVAGPPAWPRSSRWPEPAARLAW